MSTQSLPIVDHELQVSSQVSNEPTIFLRNGNQGNAQDLKGLEEGTVLKLTILFSSPHFRKRGVVDLVVSFGSIYTCDSDRTHNDCCIMFEIIESRCPKTLVSWFRGNYFSLIGNQFRHLSDFQSIRVLGRITIKAEIMGSLCRERNKLRNRLTQIKKAAKVLDQTLAQ